ncbi:MAG TPA: dihydrodipicolinate reductase C-terminal domain-containing protein [Synergistales bacterium]|nr:dihydrodipicolinate reductase C-terminal domain-containing protein [Synergistales bacterium]
MIIDFSSFHATFRTIELCREHHAGLVIGTTALKPEHLSSLRDLSLSVPVIQSFNFSMGINLLKRILKDFSEYFLDWDLAITETHHVKKKDAPSGTAILLQEAIGRESGCLSLRLGGIPGDHQVIFANEGEMVTFTHRAISRKVFALGALKAAEFGLTRDKGFYSFEEVLLCRQKQ